MIFISSTVPLNKIPASKEEIYKMDWFYFSATIRNKDYLKDNELYGICYQLHLYPYFTRGNYTIILCQTITIIKVIYIIRCKTQQN